MRGFNVFGLMVFGAALFAACASSDDDPEPAPGTGGSAGMDGSASGGSAGSTGGSGGSGATGGSSGGMAGAGGSMGGMAGVPGDGSAGFSGNLGDSGLFINLTGQCGDLLMNTPVTGMKVCVFQAPSLPCATTDTSGTYTLPSVPAGSEILLSFEKTGYFPVLRTITTDVVNMDDGTVFFPNELAVTIFAGAVLDGGSIDSSKGQILLSAFINSSTDGGTALNGGQAGVSTSITPASGIGPVFTGSGNPPLPDPMATMTSDSGFGLYANVNPGVVEIEMTHPTKTCKRLTRATWAGSTPTASRVPVVAGWLTGGAALECPP